MCKYKDSNEYGNNFRLLNVSSECEIGMDCPVIGALSVCLITIKERMPFHPSIYISFSKIMDYLSLNLSCLQTKEVSGGVNYLIQCVDIIQHRQYNEKAGRESQGDSIILGEYRGGHRGGGYCPSSTPWPYKKLNFIGNVSLISSISKRRQHPLWLALCPPLWDYSCNTSILCGSTVQRTINLMY